MLSQDSLFQFVHDRQQDLLASAAVHRVAPIGPVRTRIARSLRRAADRLDVATASPGAVKAPSVGNALPGGGC